MNKVFTSRVFNPRLLAAAAAAASRAAEPLAPLMPLADVCRLPFDEVLREPVVRVRGVVIFSDPDGVAIQEGDHGLWVDIALARRREPATGAGFPAERPLGTLLEVEGRMTQGGFVPVLLPHELRIVGTAPLPAPRRVDAGRFLDAADVGTLVETDAVWQGMVATPSGAHIWLEAHGRPCMAEAARDCLPADAERLVDAEVRIAGVLTSQFNTRGEATLPVLRIARPEWISVTAAARQPPFEAPLTPLGRLAWHREQPLGGHMLRVQGTVIHAVPGEEVFLQEGPVGVRVATDATEPFVPGDRVEAAGFIDRDNRVAGLRHAVVRRIGTGPPPPPFAVFADDVVAVNRRAAQERISARPADYENCLITFPATLLERQATHRGGALRLTAGNTSVTARLSEAAFHELAGLTAGSEVAVTGIAHTEWSAAAPDGRRQPLDRLALDVRTAADVRLLRPAPWWTPRRLALVAGGLGAVAALAAAWAVALRREVRRQTTLAVEEAAGRRAAAAEFEATLRERNRLAVNLHDTVLQWLTGVDFQLKACESAGSRDDEAALPTHLAVARQMISHAASQLRGTVWSLRSVAADGAPFEESLVRLIDQATAGHDAHVSLSVAPDLPDLPPLVAGNLLLVLQEAIHNALHHATPSSVRVTVAVDRAGRDVVAEVRDDGCGFTVGEQVGPAQGHFGLDGMRERVERLGGSLAVVSAPDEGTIITARVPRKMADLAPERAVVNGRPSPVGTMTGAG
ncbi:MAG: sensor histidine kinase [Planctomycetia bacterium]